jgi:uncharacterized protein (TIGR00369 family)
MLKLILSMLHFDRLKKMYALAPIHRFYEGIELSLAEKKAWIHLTIDERYFHAAMSAHGSVYFKLLDDAAYFACQSVIPDFFIVTTSFNVHLLRPITAGKVYAVGEVEFTSAGLFTASSRLFDEKGRLCGTGQGQFVKSKVNLESVEDYKL